MQLDASNSVHATIDGLEDQKVYAFVLEPRSGDGDGEALFTYLTWLFDDVLIISKHVETPVDTTGYYMDLRLFFKCQWNKLTGCHVVQ